MLSSSDLTGLEKELLIPPQTYSSFSSSVSFGFPLPKYINVPFLSLDVSTHFNSVLTSKYPTETSWPSQGLTSKIAVSILFER